MEYEIFPRIKRYKYRDRNLRSPWLCKLYFGGSNLQSAITHNLRACEIGAENDLLCALL